MNPKKYYSKLKFLQSFIKFNSLTGNKANMFQYCKNNTEAHEDLKFKVFKELIKRRHIAYTEVEFKQGCRADVVSFDEKGNGFIFEVVNTESEDSIKNKINTYPIDFELIFCYVNKPLEIPI